MEKTLYSFNSSQDIIHLQTKYALFKRVANIVFTTVVEDGFDRTLMTAAINKLFERNDCLRITFVKDGKEIKQRFEDTRTIGKIPEVSFKNNAEEKNFILKFRHDGLKIFKGEVLKVTYAKNIKGEDVIYFKISHMVADTYGIGVLVSDLFSVYAAMKDGRELPAAPGSFEAILQKDLAYKANEELKKKDVDFFNDYYCVKHSERPSYCAFHGDASDHWLKAKAKGLVSSPYLFIKCDTKGYHFVIPACLNVKAREWCKENSITMSAFYFYCTAIASSLVNGKAKVQLPLMLLDCRGTMNERKAAGTKVQSMSVYTVVDYAKSFKDNITEAYVEQNELYKHTRLSYLEIQGLEHKLWNYPMTTQFINFCFSYIPFSAPKGVRFQVISNGKGALTLYMAVMADPASDEAAVVYDVQTELAGPEILVDFQNRLVNVMETVLNNPEELLENIF